jgi:hypothetical protein
MPRMKGKPYQGHPPYSVVAEFSVGEEMLAIEQRDFPEHWHRIRGLNFGVDHPAAAVEPHQLQLLDWIIVGVRPPSGD